MAREEIKVFISNRDSTCGVCEENLGKKAWITLEEEAGAVCLSCADLDHLVMLPSGNAAMTRRSKKYSSLTAVVLKWSRARKRYERQGILVEEAALERAEDECLVDHDLREVQKMHRALEAAQVDKAYVKDFAERVRELFPKCSKARAKLIAEHACLKYSNRVGRSAAAKNLDEEAITLAVVAHIRHTETEYHALLNKGYARNEARQLIEGEVEKIMDRWRG